MYCTVFKKNQKVESKLQRKKSDLIRDRLNWAKELAQKDNENA